MVPPESTRGRHQIIRTDRVLRLEASVRELFGGRRHHLSSLILREPRISCENAHTSSQRCTHSLVQSKLIQISRANQANAVSHTENEALQFDKAK